MYQFTRVSSNIKTGPLPTTMTGRNTCPDSCPLKNNGCYADNFPLSLAWKKHCKLSIDELTDKIKKLPRGQLWRHNVAGDLPGDNEEIDTAALDEIVRANKGRRGFTYTHKNPIKNLKTLHDAINNGFCINASANTAEQADYYHSLDLPTVCLLPSNASEKAYKTPEGNDIVTCPATIRDDVTCATCGLCADADRSFIIGFPAHGARKRKANEIACENI